MTTGATGIGWRARRTAAFAVVLALCVGGIGVSAAQAQPPLTWTTPAMSDSSAGTLGITAVTCQPGSLCVAVDDAGNFLSSTAPASSTWSSPALVDASHPHLTAVSCPTVTLCFAVDKAGDIFATTTPTSPVLWTASASPIDPSSQLNGISCPSTSLCVAVDNTGHVLTSATPGMLTPASWPAITVDGATPMTAVSCPTASLCAAVDENGNVLVSTSPATSSSWQRTQLTSTALSAVACNASALCVAVAANGSVHASANAVASPVVTWSATPIDAPGPLTAVSCTDVGLCVLVDHTGNALESDSPAGGQPNWTATDIDSTDALSGVSCLAAGFCVAVDGLGKTVAATLPPPTVTTGAGAASSQTLASLTATVNANDATLSDCHFDYGPTTAYGASVPCTVVPNATGGSQAVTAQISGLSAATTYHFRISATSGVGAGVGADATFATPAPLTARPSLSGTPAVGNTLTCEPNVTTTATETISYQWLGNSAAIPGATAATYIIAPTDQTHHLSCQVTISGDGASTTATSGFDGVPSQTAGKITETFVGTAKHASRSASAPVTCSRQAAGSCTITLTLTTTATVKHKRHKITVGSSTVKLAAGTTRRLSVSLNATGKRLLKRHKRLATTLTVRGTILSTLTATLQTDKFVFAVPKTKRHAKHRAR